MTLQLGKLCSMVLLEVFGETVQKVGDELFKWTSRTLSLIAQKTNLTPSEVKKALAVLFQHGFVSFFPSIKAPSIPEYSLIPEKLIFILRYPKYTFFIKSKYGNEAEMIMEEMFRHGRDKASSVILRAAARFRETVKSDSSLITFRDEFAQLVNNQFLNRSLAPLEEGGAVPTLFIDDKDLYVMPQLNLKILSAVDKETDSNRNPGDNGILWEVNFEKFNQELRDEMLVTAMTRRVDENAGQLMRHFLEEMYLRTDPWVDVSNPIPYNSLKERIKEQNTHPKLLEFLESYCMILNDDPSGFISKTADGGGGQYVVNMKEAITQFTWITIETVVLERFGSKAARIFRIVKAKQKVDQDQIQPIAMIPAKEAKSITYQLLEENFLQIEELRKTGSNNGPVKNFFVFHIVLNQISRLVLNMCYKTVYNLMVRREQEINDNKRLIDKHHRIKSVVQNMKEQDASDEQIAEVEEMITPIEVSLVEKVEKMVSSFSAAELQADNSIFILQMFIFFQEKPRKK